MTWLDQLFVFYSIITYSIIKDKVDRHCIKNRIYLKEKKNPNGYLFDNPKIFTGSVESRDGWHL